MINPPEAQKRATEMLVGFPPRIPTAYVAFAETGGPADLDLVVLGVLSFYLSQKPNEPLESLPGTTRLIEDLGCDSLTMIDTVFMVEGLFDVKIDDATLARLATLDDLRGHLRKLVQGDAAPAA